MADKANVNNATCNVLIAQRIDLNGSDGGTNSSSVGGQYHQIQRHVIKSCTNPFH